MVLAWFEDPDLAALQQQLRDLPVETRWSTVEEVDWQAAWRATIHPLRITERLVVAPPWDAPPGALILEPGSGFGSGTHPSTRMALIAVEDLAPGLSTALDVGCGSGILGIAAARHGLQVEGIDVEETAIVDARANAARNQVDADWSTRPVHLLEGRRDLVLGNLHAELIVRLAPDLIRLTGRWLVLAGIIVDREPLVRAAMDPHLTLDHRVEDGEWVGLRYRRAD